MSGERALDGLVSDTIEILVDGLRPRTEAASRG
jgi:hypothetical protein